MLEVNHIASVVAQTLWSPLHKLKPCYQLEMGVFIYFIIIFLRVYYPSA